MKFGLLYEMQRPHEDYVIDHTALIEETLEQCIKADEVGFDYLFRQIAPDGSLFSIRVREFEEPVQVSSGTVLRRYLNQLGTDPAYQAIQVDLILEDQESIAGLRQASRATLRYRRGGLDYTSTVVALAYGDRRSFAIDLQLAASVASDAELANESEAILASLIRL